MKTMSVFILLFAGLSISSVKLDSQAWTAVPQEGKGCSAPREWGQLKGVADRAVAFEDSSGYIRILDLGPCMRGETKLIVGISRP